MDQGRFRRTKEEAITRFPCELLRILDEPPEVAAACERLDEYAKSIRTKHGRDTYHGTTDSWAGDMAIVARHYLKARAAK